MMRTIRHTILLLAAMAVARSATAQQEVMVSQYMFNQLFLNPAYAGSHGYAGASMLHRSQWVGMEGAPSTSMLAIDAPLMNNKMGLGFSLVQDQIGISRDLDMSAHYAYHLQLGPASKIALGLRAGVSLYSARFSDLVYWDANDQMYQNDISNAVVGKFGFGVYWYDATSYVGVSVPTITSADGAISVKNASELDHYFTQHFYLHAGKVFPLGEYFDLKPSTLVKFQPDAPMEVDINLNVLYRERIWLGAGYRTGDAVVAMLEYQVTPQLRVGYAYDMNTSRLRSFNSGSHEVMLGVDFGRDLVKIKTPRYF